MTRLKSYTVLLMGLLIGITLFACGKNQEVTITFETHGGTAVDALIIQRHDPVTLPNPPVKEGFIFIGWYFDDGVYHLSFDEDTVIDDSFDQEVTVYARFIEAGQIRVIFETNTVFNVPDIYVDRESRIHEPNIQKSGHTLLGWVYFNEDIDDYILWSFNEDKVTEAITLIAQWEKKNYTIDYYMYDTFDHKATIHLMSDETIERVELGWSHTALLTSKGRLYMWGENSYGQIGNNTLVNQWTPYDITDNFDLEPNERIIDVSLGTNFSSALTSSGRMFTWGQGESGKLGNNAFNDAFLPVDITEYFNLPDDEIITHIDIHAYNASAVTSHQRIFTWGLNNHSQIGNGLTGNLSTPQDITGFINFNDNENIVSLSVGGTSVLLTSEHRIFTWGNNYLGQMATGDTNNRSTPTDITDNFILSSNEVITTISIMGTHGIALSNLNQVYVWGNDTHGQYQPDSENITLVPKNITHLFALDAHDKIVNVKAGNGYATALSRNNEVFMWGRNQNGKLGIGTLDTEHIPTNITAHFDLKVNEIIHDVFVHYIHTAAITTHQNLYLWGANTRGQLGIENAENQMLPHLTPINRLSHIHQDSAFYDDAILHYQPTHASYAFGGWYQDALLSEPFIFETMPNHNLVLYGRWIKD